MKAIVIVFMRARDAAATEQTLALCSSVVSQAPIDLDRARNNFRQLPDSDQTTAPFWTWFIENPRQASA